ncbi:solute carrier family 26 member prestin isoform X2 [Arctopsyche grandis]|uniref:solute carrier family 26 member prestin isoform X2 n=1 Tax=Arctopsyche grandis TaxID=121162 RepID=UPI00406DA095
MSQSEKEKLYPEWTSDSFNVIRPVYLQEDLDRQAEYHKPNKTVSEKCGSLLRACGLVECVKNVLPVTHWLPKYSFKNDLVSDIISGCTIAVMHIPQGMAYAMLSGAPPVVGLYMAFFPVFIYFLLGTSRHISMGTFAVICLMTAKSIQTYADVDNHGVLIHTNNATDSSMFDDNVVHYSPIQVGTAVCLMVGIYQTLMWVFRLGVMSSLLSEPLVSGFITGATAHVLSSQFKDLFGVQIGNHKGYFKIVMLVVDVIQNLPGLNWASFIISILSITALYLNNDVLKPHLNKLCRIPVPIELILVVTGTLVSKYFHLKETYGVKLVGEIPTGIPAPQLPPLELLPKVALDSFSITIVSYTVTMSMALIFATKEKYEVNGNQELLAMGAGNIFGAFFSCVPFCASLSRSSIQYGAGGKTQIASVVSCSILVCVLLWIAPFFEVLPCAVLAAIIVVALKGMMMQAKDIVRFWKLSKLDAMVWVITCTVVILIEVDIGLLVGMLASIGTLFIRAQSPYTCLLGCVSNTDIYLDINRYKAALEIPGIKIFHYCGGLNFASKSGFKDSLFRKINFSAECKSNLISENNLLKKENGKDLASFEFTQNDNRLQFLIMDLTGMCYVDASGVGMLRSVSKDVEKFGVQTLLARANGPIMEMMEKFDKLETGQNKMRFTIFPSVHDAVLYAVSQMQTQPPIITSM